MCLDILPSHAVVHSFNQYFFYYNQVCHFSRLFVVEFTQFSCAFYAVLIFSVTCGICMSCLCYEHDVRPSVRPSVTLTDCDHAVQQKVEIGT